MHLLALMSRQIAPYARPVGGIGRVVCYEMLFTKMKGSLDNEFFAAHKSVMYPGVVVPRGIAQEQFGTLLLKLNGRAHISDA